MLRKDLPHVMDWHELMALLQKDPELRAELDELQRQQATLDREAALDLSVTKEDNTPRT